MSSTKRGLGGGLSNLFGGDVTDLSAAGAAAGGVTQLSLSRIEPNPNQPRKVFDPNALEELAESIRLHGVITPITVRAGEKSGYYQIIAGERRWRAARMAGLKEIPAMVLEARESEIMELALIENLQRQDLNPIEEAEGYDLLMRQFGLTQEEVARRVVKSRPAVANALRLLALPDEVRVMVSEGKLSGGHARAVLAVSEADKRVEAARQMAGMTVRQAEAVAKKLNKKPVQKTESAVFSVDYLSEAARELESVLGRKVSIQQGKTSGTLTLEYYGSDDLERLNMDEQKKTPDGPKPEKKLSRTTLTFYIIGLFTVALALILISYIAQARADRQLDTLTNQLTEQQTVAQGATQKMEDLQKQFDAQSKALDGVRSALDSELAHTDVVAAATLRMEERDVYAGLARISAQLLSENTEDAVREYDALVEKYGAERLLGRAAENSFGSDINKLFEAVQKQIEDLTTEE